MDQVNEQEQLAILYRAGFTRVESERLARFRRKYLKYRPDQDQACLDFAHLQFIRWLVEHGKLTEHLR